MTYEQIKPGNNFDIFYGDGSQMGSIVVTKISDFFVFFRQAGQTEKDFREGATNVKRYLLNGMWKLKD